MKSLIKFLTAPEAQSDSILGAPSDPILVLNEIESPRQVKDL